MIKIKHIQEVEDGKVVKQRFEIWRAKSKNVNTEVDFFITALREGELEELKEELKKYDN